MNRARLVVLLSFAVAIGTVAFAFGKGAAADGASAKRLIYLYVSGKGPQAKAWYDGGPPSGVQIQTALDKWTGDGYRFVAMTSGAATNVNLSSSPATSPASNDAAPGADFVLLLEH